ncbi:coiled-coil domain-containing protein 57 isoform X3 [Corvus moneduloides]|uniref:coiled-coil domain-containing protein 57 isoform X3 n=1 Tax=Corvus moneduloides TaxID=1196302 RepID=UPI00136432AA|nr:coiled-coil domain-containing protein 57 isoform X3 [Corvus moneduloides]
MWGTKPELAGVPRATGVPPRAGGTTRLGVIRLPEEKPGAALSPSRLSGARWPAPLSARTALQTDADEDVGRSIRQRGFPEAEVRPPGPMRGGKTQPAGWRPADRRGVVPTGARTVGVVLTAPRAPSAASGRVMNPGLLCRACPKLGRRSGASGGPESPTERSALGQPGALDSAHPAPDPPTPRSPRRSSPWARQASRNITHDGSASVPESRPALQREDAPARAGPQPAVPVCRRRPAPARLVPPAGERSRAVGLWLLAPPCHTGRPLGPIAATVTLSLRYRFFRAGAPGPHKASSRALRCLRRVQGTAGFCRRGCCTGCPEEQDLSSGLQRMNGFLRLSSRNSHIDHLHEDYVNLKLHMEQKIQELEDTDVGNWYEEQPSLAAEREWIPKQSKMQTELNWQQLCEKAECNSYQKSEDLTHRLSSSREEIFQYDDKSSLYKDIPALEIKKLQEQNASLRNAITQMRKEMESLDEQMLSSLPLTENRQLAEQGSLSTNKVSTGTMLSNVKVSSTKLDCMVNPDTEKEPEPKALEENMVDFGQQLPDVGTGVGCQYCVKRTLRGMQNKLKEAARKISILSQEKQQLIEMGNRLRAERGMLLKEGLWHPVSSKHCTICIGSLLPRELVKRTQCQLSVLNHLQHSLSSQELRYARQQHPSRFSSLIACPSLKEEEAPSSCGEETEVPSAEVRLDFCMGNHGPDTSSATKADTSSKIVQLLSQSPSQVQQVQLSSSRAHNFCQGVCQILDTGSSLSILSPRKNTSQVEFEVVHSTQQSEESQQNVKAKDKFEMSAEDLTVRGTRLEVQQKLKPRSLSCAHLLKPKISCSMAKIRNYNIKD